MPLSVLIGCVSGWMLCGIWAPATAWSASHYETELLFFAGKYEQAAEIARQEIDRGVWNELWPELYLRCLLVQGKYEAARAAYEAALARYGDRIAYRYLGAEVYQFVNQPELAAEQLRQLELLVTRSPWRFGSARDQVVLGRYFVGLGEDGRQVLELIYDRVRKQSPQYPEVYVAAAELALEKQDKALAAEELRKAAELQPSNPQIFYLLARATADEPDGQSDAALAKALELNPRHVPSLLLAADQRIDAEDYVGAQQRLEQVLEINLREPAAWAYHAVIAHLQGHYVGEQALRRAALEPWTANPQVDHLIGLKLSQKYRFREGVIYQRRALEKRPNDVAAKFQLAHDLLRLGDEVEGWRLADEVQRQDNYHVVAFNLVTLKSQLARFRTLESPHFVVRMDAREAEIYGTQVLTLLEQAYDVLCPKYAAELAGPVQVEIFPRQEDFAIRTFGLPGGAGYLGVCFGRLITANSPASQGPTPTNWQSVLWHEFCHVVTLEKTHNRMPRWLSEGISVYEERQRNPAWGQKLTPTFRQWLLDDQIRTPVSRLSEAFLRPRSAQHLQFAYYESSLVVEFLMQELGPMGLQRTLADLAVGMPIEESLQRYLGSLQSIDERFATFARERAQQDAPDLDWQGDLIPPDADRESLNELLQEHPRNYYLLVELARAELNAGNPAAALNWLTTVCDARPHDVAAIRLTVQAAHDLGDAAAEVRALDQWIAVDADAIDPRMRRAELARTAEDWARVHDLAEQLLAVNPLLVSAQQLLAEAANHRSNPAALIASQRALLQLAPQDPAAAYYRLALASQQLGDAVAAKRYVLRALEETPRYRDAQRLLLQLVTEPVAGPAESPADPQASSTPAPPPENSSPSASTAAVAPSDPASRSTEETATPAPAGESTAPTLDPANSSAEPTEAPRDEP